MAINLSQKNLAFLLDLPAPEVSYWEKGRRKPGIYNAIGLAVATQRFIEDVFFDYYAEWRGLIAERKKLLVSKQNGKTK